MANTPPNRKSIFQTYRILPLVLAGLVFLILLVLICLLVWSLIAYYTQAPVSAEALWPRLIYLGGLFVTAALMTLLIKGGTVFPAAALSLTAAAVTLLLAGEGQATIAPALLKALLSLVAGVLGFTLAKLWVRHDAARRNARVLAKGPRPPLPEPAATRLTPTPLPEDYGMEEKSN